MAFWQQKALFPFFLIKTFEFNEVPKFGMFCETQKTRAGVVVRAALLSRLL